jgi:hypothetical protein
MKVSAPETVIVLFEAPAKVGLFVAPVKSIFRQFAFTFIVTVCPPAENEFASKKTLSADVGILAPLAPPLVVDQCAVLFQLPVPPTQYLFAGNIIKGKNISIKLKILIITCCLLTQNTKKLLNKK